MYAKFTTLLLGLLASGSQVIAASVSSRTTTCPPSSPSPLTSANWIWTNEVTSSLETAPVGSRAFRGRLHIPTDQTPIAATVTISTDNAYELWVQGQLVGTHDDWTHAQVYTVPLPAVLQPANQVVIAVNATNDPGASQNEAGLIMAVNIELACGAVVGYVTDGSWKFDGLLVGDMPQDYWEPNFNDEAWTGVFVEGPYGVAPWGAITVDAPAFSG